MISDAELIEIAKRSLNPRRLSPTAEAGGVGCALVTDKGNVYAGVCIDTASGLGFCAERNAIGAMVTQGESRIETIVAVDWNKTVLSPCGTCREFIWLVDAGNRTTRVLLKDGRVASLTELLPDHWLEGKAMVSGNEPKMRQEPSVLSGK